MLLVLLAAAVVGIVASLAFGSPFADKPVTKKQIEARGTKRTRGKVQRTLCNEEVRPSETPQPKNVKTWTCDTYIGPNKAEAQNGPSYAVTVKDGDIASMRRVPVHEAGPAVLAAAAPASSARPRTTKTANSSSPGSTAAG